MEGPDSISLRNQASKTAVAIDLGTYNFSCKVSKLNLLGAIKKTSEAQGAKGARQLDSKLASAVRLSELFPMALDGCLLQNDLAASINRGSIS